MKKLMILAALTCATMARADFLYWSVDLSDDSIYSFNYATVKATDGNGTTGDYLKLYGGGQTESSSTKVYSSNYGVNGDYSLGTTTGGGTFAGLDANGGISSFLVELWTDGATSDAAATRVGYTSLAYSDLVSYIYSDMAMRGDTPYVVTDSQLVPEPTSGLLALLGVAALALKRKHQKA